VLAALLLAVSVLVGLSGSALASVVHAGFDFFATQPESFQDFARAPIPANFFDPFSDPFTGRVNFSGVPLDPTTSNADTIVQRLAPAKFTRPFPSTETIPIQIVRLSLRSVSPIPVTYSGGRLRDFWWIDVSLSQVAQEMGTMSLMQVNKEGGTFGSTLPVQTRLTFTRVTDGAQRVIDTGLIGLRPLRFQAQGVPWSHKAPKNIITSGRFCAGCLNGVPGSIDEFSIVGVSAFHKIVPATRAA
jgi:hypothetical protein